MHVRWTDRSNNNVDEEYIVFPEVTNLEMSLCLYGLYFIHFLLH